VVAVSGESGGAARSVDSWAESVGSAHQDSGGLGGPSSTAAATATRPRPERRPLRERPNPIPRPAPVVISRRDRRRVHIVERFTGKRVHNRVGGWRRVRSIVLLIILGAILAAVVAAVFAAVIAGLTLAFNHASHN
jgi:hypothetical protein